MIDGVVYTPLLRIEHPKGDILRGLKVSEPSFTSFGEAYFSSITNGEIKGWKKHREMVLNLIVPVGSIKFVIYDDRPNSGTHGQFSHFILNPDNYGRLTVPQGVWLAFQGVGTDLNLLLNIASIEHAPEESISQQIDSIEYDWSCE
ncbi:dTDP-4-dehydrorhamnose 3,5-epimerase family protein [Vibrio methylphosphonaticus]|uniref:dTDP-4-dehydrorhamnose 3,5-epimerase family protein n=1 Tax=Vibrio methylphosphonaticus TaxID=2946866 RepID=UPI00202AB58C|nr:dTDP-4-dehydrorhamnose 3,5-epimerase family protein [Vibrio methylphosphonaticus]MCL9775545.1 dTDP-4-dehydrorhamnose 3,5-epimerase family protein [Vibrio methylphosphonaticus]